MPKDTKVAKSRIRLRVTTGSWLPGNIKMHARAFRAASLIRMARPFAIASLST